MLRQLSRYPATWANEGYGRRGHDCTSFKFDQQGLKGIDQWNGGRDLDITGEAMPVEMLQGDPLGAGAHEAAGAILQALRKRFIRLACHWCTERTRDFEYGSGPGVAGPVFVCVLKRPAECRFTPTRDNYPKRRHRGAAVALNIRLSGIPDNPVPRTCYGQVRNSGHGRAEKHHWTQGA